MNKSNNDDYIYELLNYYNIEDEVEADPLDDLTAKRIEGKIKTKIKKKKIIPNKVKVAVAGVFIATNMILVFTNGQEVYANIGKSIIKTFKEIVGDHADYEKYSTSVNLSTYDKGVKVEVNEVVTDGSEINIAYSLISDGKLKDIVGNPNIFMAQFTVGGKDIGGYGSSGEMVNDNRYDGYLSIRNSSGITLQDTFTLDMKANFIGTLEGNWELKINVDKNNIKDKIKEYNVGKAIDLGDGDRLKINKISTSPLSISMEISGDMWKYSYFLFDDKGNEIIAKGGGSQNDKGSINFRSLINDDTKSLTFIPYKISDDYKVDPRIYDINTLPLELSQGSIGKLIVNELEWIGDDTLKVHYNAEGMIPVTQSHSIILIDEDNNMIISEDKYNTQRNIFDQKNFEMVFKGVDKNKKYKIAGAKIDEFYEIREDLKFTIDLK
ncbi:DUF4179 domain-containing protein [Clostridium sp. LP20]|uniref:DUF4179 domain-containing protein n=1 Tax=Clostridium sp. LP20 TaxID=3418665 RepID=UPI003EE7FFDF